jgi:hypothetical protein
MRGLWGLFEGFHKDRADEIFPEQGDRILYYGF